VHIIYALLSENQAAFSVLEMKKQQSDQKDCRFLD
jgi:hypothetical protein